jgi:MFS family permease
MKSNLITFWTELFLKPKLFFKKNLRDSSRQPAYYNIAMIIYCIGYGIDRLDLQLMKLDLRGKLDEAGYLNNWIVYWLIAIIGGLIGGYILYHIGGWFFNLRLKWSKGTSDIEKSKHIYLYSGVVSNSIIVLTTLISMTFNNKPYISDSGLYFWDIISPILLLFFVYYSIYISYSGVRSITDADKLRSKLWFIIIPVIFYTVVYITVFTLILKLI